MHKQLNFFLLILHQQFFLESPHIPNWKILEEHKVISYIHHDKNGGSCNFLAKKNKLPITSCCGGNNSLNSNYSFKIEIVHTTILGCPEFSSFAKFWSASFSHQTMNHHFSERDMTVHFPPSSLARSVESFSNYFPGEKYTYNALKNTRKLSTMRRFRDRKLRQNSLSSIHSSIPFFPTRVHNFTVASQKHSCSTCIAKYNNITQRGELAEEMLIFYSCCHLSTWSESLESFLADPTLRYNS